MELDDYVLPLEKCQPQLVRLLLVFDVLDVQLEVLRIYDEELHAVYLLHHLVDYDEALVVVYLVRLPYHAQNVTLHHSIGL